MKTNILVILFEVFFIVYSEIMICKNDKCLPYFKMKTSGTCHHSKDKRL